MSANYRLDIRTAAGVKKAEISDFLWLNMVRKVNTPGYLTIGFADNHRIMSLLEDFGQIELWRRDLVNGIGWYREFDGIYRQNRREQQGADGRVEVTAHGWAIKLAWRVVAYQSGVDNRTTFSGAPAESIMKLLVEYNCAASATISNGRLRDAAISGLSVDTDGAGGNVLDWACFGENVLANLQNLALVGGGDFDLLKTSGANCKFYWYGGQRGSDRHSEVIFALGRGNMADPVYVLNRTDERSVAIVGGQDTGTSRAFVVRTSAAYSSENDSEVMVNASDLATTEGLNARGDRALMDRRAEEEFSFSVMQTPGCVYGRDYFLGDLVTTANPFTSASITQKVNGLTVGVGMDGAETIRVELETV